MTNEQVRDALRDLGQRLRMVEDGLDVGGATTVGILQTVDARIESTRGMIETAMGVVSERVTALEETMSKAAMKKELADVMDVGKRDLRDMVNKTEEEGKAALERLQTVVKELQKWTSKVEGEMGEKDQRVMEQMG